MESHTVNGSLNNGYDQIAACNEWVRKITQEGITRDEVLDTYRKWTTLSDYESDMNAVGYQATVLTVKYCAESFPVETRSEARILDVGAGTGMVARGLRELGFRHIDALDSSEDMLNMARKDRLYDKYHCAFLSEKQLLIASDTYDAVTASGCFIGGHIPCAALHELIRIVKPEFLCTVSEYKDRLEPLMKKLEKEGKWKKIARIIEPDYFLERNGISWIYQVLP